MGLRQTGLNIKCDVIFNETIDAEIQKEMFQDLLCLGNTALTWLTKRVQTEGIKVQMMVKNMASMSFNGLELPNREDNQLGMPQNLMDHKEIERAGQEEYFLDNSLQAEQDFDHNHWMGCQKELQGAEQDI